MIARDLITDEIPPLKPNESALKAMSWMDEFKVSHLPVVDKREFLGLISESDILDLKSTTNSINESGVPLINVFSYDYHHLFEVVKTLSDSNLTVIPVLNQQDQYIGSITITKLMKVIAEMSVVSDPGGIVELELNVNDYSLSEVAQIVESNNAKILGSFITSHPDSTKIQLTFKANRNDLGAILQTFNRYNYTVTAAYDQGNREEDMKERFDSFMKYLDI
ncbi:CBS domain-containing protein [Flavobacteriales bacterium]|jgi:predicted transcriptional regulator|nr:CBS domain-containing protein [Flavobacteriales bacterium]